MQVQANGIAIEVEIAPATAGAPEQAPVILLAGWGMQLIDWPAALLQSLADDGHVVIRLDNRDVGLSQSMHSDKKTSLLSAGLRHTVGLPVPAPYTVQDMADDARGVLDALKVERVHVIGMSMGGMIAQRLAATLGPRAISLTSIMSSSGARGLPGPKRHIQQLMMEASLYRTVPERLEYLVRVHTALAGPTMPIPPDELRAQQRADLERAPDPRGLKRQMLAVMADHERPRVLARIHSPTLVIHGIDDPMVPVACGEDTLRRIPGAKLLRVAGMGHALSPGALDAITEPMLNHLRTSEAANVAEAS